jgi:hypothetical protein
MDFGFMQPIPLYGLKAPMVDQEFETLDGTTLDERTEAHETNDHNHHGISDNRSRFRDLRG